MYISVMYRVVQTEYGIRILVAASQEYVNTYATRRLMRRAGTSRQRQQVSRVHDVGLYTIFV